MSALREVLGHIDCPTCGTAKGMRITHDKNGDPFGYCEANCSQQMRVGGDARRVRDFIARHPWAAKPVPVTGAPSAPVPVTETKPVEKPKPAPVTVPVTVTVQPKPVTARVPGPFDFLGQRGRTA